MLLLITSSYVIVGLRFKYMHVDGKLFQYSIEPPSEAQSAKNNFIRCYTFADIPYH